MTKQDGRKLDKAAKEERRRTIIRMKENGASEKDIRAATGCCKQIIYTLWNKWRQCKPKLREETVLKVKAAGTKKGERRILTPQQEQQIQTLIKDKYPDQLNLDCALWTREAVMKLIEQQFGIKIALRTVGEYLKRWGFTPQKPVKKAYERDPKKVEEWLNKTYPAIKSKAKRNKADIFWCDETGVGANDVRGRGYAPKGQTPVVEPTGKRGGISMISAITNQGKILWKLYESSIVAVLVLEFVQQLVKYRRRPVYLILDNASTHHSTVLLEWVAANKKRIEVFYLPPYSPDLNPDEYVNSDVKYGVGSKHPKRTKAALRETTEEHMNMLQNNPERVKLYFQAQSIKYAA